MFICKCSKIFGKIGYITEQLDVWSSGDIYVWNDSSICQKLSYFCCTCNVIVVQVLQ